LKETLKSDGQHLHQSHIARNDRWFAHLYIQNGGKLSVSLGWTIFRDKKIKLCTGYQPPMHLAEAFWTK